MTGYTLNISIHENKDTIEIKCIKNVDLYAPMDIGKLIYDKKSGKTIFNAIYEKSSGEQIPLEPHEFDDVRPLIDETLKNILKKHEKKLAEK